MNKKTTPVKRTHKTTKNSGKVFLKKPKHSKFLQFHNKEGFSEPRPKPSLPSPYKFTSPIKPQAPRRLSLPPMLVFFFSFSFFFFS